MDDEMKKLATYASRMGLKINAKKTKLMRINNKEQRPIEVNGKWFSAAKSWCMASDQVNGINIGDVEEFTYLRATVSTKGGGTEDISTRPNKGSHTFQRLKKHVTLPYTPKGPK